MNFHFLCHFKYWPTFGVDFFQHLGILEIILYLDIILFKESVILQIIYIMNENKNSEDYNGSYDQIHFKISRVGYM